MIQCVVLENGLSCFLGVFLSPFQLQIPASIRERPLRATWATMAAPTLPATAIREPTLLFGTERGFGVFLLFGTQQRDEDNDVLFCGPTAFLFFPTTFLTRDQKDLNVTCVNRMQFAICHFRI